MFVTHLDNANASVQFYIDSEAGFHDQIKDLDREVQRQQDLGQGYYDSMMTFKEKADSLSATIQRLKKTARSGDCQPQRVYQDTDAAAIERLQKDVPTMPVIPKDVAIAIFREGVQSGVVDAISELEGQTINICENEYVGDFEVTFARDVRLDDELDFDWMRNEVGQYSEAFVVGALAGLCALNKVRVPYPRSRRPRRKEE